ncbi:MAG: sensor histidine kinase [Chitinispirillaceae bacterium]
MEHVDQKILVKQVQVIYRLYFVGLIATTINATAIVALHWNLIPRTILITWLAVVLVFAALREAVSSFFRADREDIGYYRKWKTWAVVSVTISGVLWGAAAFFMLMHQARVFEIAVALVICGMVSGAAATLSPIREVYFGFFFPALTPLVILFLSSGIPVYIVLALIMILYGVLVSYSAQTNYRILKSNFELVFRNDDLISFLRKSNDMARKEIRRRQAMEMELKASHENLERTVQQRTSDLLEANEDLKVQMQKRINAEQALRRSEEQYRSMIETAQEGIWIIDETHHVTYANSRAADMLGYTTAEMRGRDMCDFLDESQRSFHSSDRRVRGVRQKTLYRKDGSSLTVLESQSTMAVDSGGKKLTLGMITDITERQKWEKTIIDLNGRLQETNSELSEFSHSVSHDLRLPLSTIDGFAQMLEEHYGNVLGKEGGTYISYIRTSARRMNELIRDLLSLSEVSRTELDKTNVDLTALSWEIMNRFKAREPRRRAEIRIAQGLSAFCDEGLMRIALENLLGNAWKYTGRNEETCIEFGSDERDGRRIFFVKDNGVGFDMTHQSKLFQPFRRLPSAAGFSGTGVGLATVHRIIVRHGGDIWAISAPGKGAVFYFTL